MIGVLLFFPLIFARSLGIRYEDMIGIWISDKDREVRESFEPSAAIFTIEDGIAVSCNYLGSKSITSPLAMLEDDFDRLSFEGILVPVEQENGDTGYLVDGYETLLDGVGINHLCISTVLDPSFLKRRGIANVVIGSRSYFDEPKVRMLGESLSGALDGTKVCVVPESLCGLVYKTKHITDDNMFHCLVITMSGTKTVFSLYKVEIGESRRFENLFHIDFDLISDGHLRKIIYNHIIAKLNEYISERSVGRDDYRKVTFYPRQRESELFELKVDMRPMYKEIVKALANRDMVNSVKIIEGLNVTDDDGKTKFVVEAPMFSISSIYKEFSELLESHKSEIDEVISTVKNKIIEKIGNSTYSVLVRSEFSGNSEFEKILGRFGNRDDIKPVYVEEGASIIGEEGYEVVDPRMLTVEGVNTTGSLFLEEVGLRNEIKIILDREFEELGEIFRDVPHASLEGVKDLLNNADDLEGIRRAVYKWRSLHEEDNNVRKERKEREKALKNLKDTISSTENQGKANRDVWNGGLHEYVIKTRKQLKDMEEDVGYKKDQIEDVEFDLIVKSRGMFVEHEKKIRMEQEEAKKEEAQSKDEARKEDDVGEAIEEVSVEKAEEGAISFKDADEVKMEL